MKPHLQILHRQFLDALIARRPGETKLGECVQTIQGTDWQAELWQSAARFVLLGIPEDIGVRANMGIGGTQTVWPAALQSLLNVQQTDKLHGDDILVLGAFDCAAMMQQMQTADVAALRDAVTIIDTTVAPAIQQIVAAGKVPIVVGGGHNNAYTLLMGASMAKGEKVNCINLDAHSDYRATEGRHSGNGFRYAVKNGYMERYAVVGLHENYNAQSVLNELAENDNMYYSFYEDIFIHQKLSFEESVRQALQHTQDRPRGIELDVDCIERVLASAASPCGITTLEARQYINWCAGAGNAAYLHIPEGATRLNNDKEDALTGKLIAYLITDFVKAYV